MTIKLRFQIPGYTAPDWTAGNPVLLARELAFETDTGRVKLGDGAKAWKDLPYQPFWSRWGRIEGALADQADLATALGLLLARSSNLGDLADVVKARANLGLKALALRDTINGNDWSGLDLAIADGGTGASTAAAARSNLGLGTMATEQAGDYAKADLGITAISGNYTLTLNDRGRFVYPSPPGLTVTIPTNAAVALPIGTRVLVVNLTGGATSLAPASGVGLFGPSGNKGYALANNNVATLLKVAANTWAVFGAGLS